MPKQATKANEAQISQHVARQKLGIKGMEFAQAHPILDVIGSIALLIFFGWGIASQIITDSACFFSG